MGVGVTCRGFGRTCSTLIPYKEYAKGNRLCANCLERRENYSELPWIEKHWSLLFWIAVILLFSKCAHGIDIDFVGDINFTSYIGESIAAHGTDYPFAEVKKELAKADYRIANLESPVGIGGAKYCNKLVYFKGNPHYLDALTDANFNLVSLANNHALDYGPDILAQTQSELTKRGISYVGVVSDAYHAQEPVVVAIKGVKVAFLAYCNVCPNEFTPRSTTAGVATGLRSVIDEQVRKVKPNVDFVVVIEHWGSEYYGPDINQKKLAKHMSEIGVDLILGCHPHVLQKITKVGDTLVAYSMGNFIFPMGWFCSLDSTIVTFHLEKGQPITWDFVPISLTTRRPEIVKSLKRQKRIAYILNHGYEYNNFRGWPKNGPWE